MEREEYTRDNYPTSGKKYNGEKAIISLTSWRARINTVDKTIYSLIKQCPGFHIVLVLSEQEFPKKEEELPERLMLFVENEQIELLWVYKNYKSLKKMLFTMDKYRDVPVISADDDCIYTCNYAQELYNEYDKNKNTIITNCFEEALNCHTAGPCTLFYPYCFGREFDIHEALKIVDYSKYLYVDDAFIEYLRAKYKDSPIICLRNKVFYFHDEINPMHNVYRQKGFLENLRKEQTKDAGRNIFEVIKS